jgi:hypothetical protein
MGFLRAALATARRLRDLADPLITRALPLAREVGALPARRPDFRRHQRSHYIPQRVSPD